jgi:arylsulfatase A-like enzyme
VTEDCWTRAGRCRCPHRGVLLIADARIAPVTARSHPPRGVRGADWRLGLPALAAILVFLAGSGACRRAAPRPNVVLISLDTLRADRLNTYGYRDRAVSPHIDGLARDGILFERHITASPWTTPAHLSLLTSLWPHSHGVIQSVAWLLRGLHGGGEYQRMAASHQTLAEVLARGGYTTAAFTGGSTLDPTIGFDQGFDLYDTSMAKVSAERLAVVTEWIAAHRHRPFFLFWHTFEVHAPYHDGTFLGDVLPPEKAAVLDRQLAKVTDPEGPFLAEDVGKDLLRDADAYTPAVCSALYDGGVRSADRWVGRILEALRAAGLYDRTLVVLTSDHGEQLGEASDETGGAFRDGRFYSAHGHTLYEELIHVPLIVKLPGAPGPARRVSAVSRAIDVMPTILDVVGLAPAAPGPQQGLSLRPLWEGRPSPPRQAFTEALSSDRESKSLEGSRYKYVVSMWPRQVGRHGRSWVAPEERLAGRELYDLTADPGERRNLLRDPTPETRRLARRFDTELRRRAAEAPGNAERTQLSEEALERLRALGYIE